MESSPTPPNLFFCMQCWWFRMKQEAGWYSAELGASHWDTGRSVGWQNHQRFWKLVFMFSEETQPRKGQDQALSRSR